MFASRSPTEPVAWLRWMALRKSQMSRQALSRDLAVFDQRCAEKVYA